MKTRTTNQQALADLFVKMRFSLDRGRISAELLEIEDELGRLLYDLIPEEIDYISVIWLEDLMSNFQTLSILGTGYDSPPYGGLLRREMLTAKEILEDAKARFALAGLPLVSLNTNKKYNWN
jgi:hypothetical protein